MCPLDLSVLQGNDPAGLKAESIIKERIEKASHPDTHSTATWERQAHSQGVQQNPGSVAAADSGQFHAYRKNRRHEMDRLEAMDRAKQLEIEQEEFERKRNKRIQEEAAKTAKRRAKRKKNSFKKVQLENDNEKEQE